jgi:cytidine deaminase
MTAVELSKRDDASSRELCDIACAAAKLAYAPYSRFRVGAAVATPSGVHTGTNVENASFGLSLCAERSAISHAVSSGDTELTRIAVACIDADPAGSLNASMPCGACRQWFIEFSPALEVLIWTPSGDIYGSTAAELLPVPFALG